MMRFFSVCIVLGAISVAAVVLTGNYFFEEPGQKEARGGAAAKPGAAGQEGGSSDEAPPAATNSDSEPAYRPSGTTERDVTITPVKGDEVAQTTMIQGARVLPLERIEVPSERDGKLLFLASPVPEDEWVPADKAIHREVSLLGVLWKDGDEVRYDSDRKPLIKEPFRDPESKRLYRFPRPNDSFEPGTTKVVRVKMKFRKLAENDEVEEGQFLGVINPAIAVADMAAKESGVQAAAADVRASASMKEESKRRLAAIVGARSRVRGSVTDDDYGAAVVTVDRYEAEEVAKKAAVVKARQELAGAWTVLDLHLIRASISGKIRTIYRQPGEAVKNLENVLQLQNTKRMRVEAQVEVQDALPLQDRLKRAEAYRNEARENAAKNPDYAKKLRAMADDLVAVQVELTRPEPPRSVLSGHMGEVTCVAVSKGPLSKIISGSEEGVVRIWERLAGADRWHQRMRLDHGVPVRAVACTGPKSTRNFLVTATSTGHIRLFDLEGLDAASKPRSLVAAEDKQRHRGAVSALAITADGTLCASAGEDGAICIWNLLQGSLLTRRPNAHRSSITSLAFAPDGRLVSAGRDRRLAIWKLEDDKLNEISDIKNRSGEVAVLGIDPTGQKVLFDEGRELRVLGLDQNLRIEGSLVNPGAAGTFAHMALYSPNGRTILTNGNAPGRLQLWRAPSEKSQRAAELRQLLWATGTATCGAFDPAGQFAVTGTSDHRVLVWDLPRNEEATDPLAGQLTYAEEFLDTGLKQLTIRATLSNAPDWAIPGSLATILLPAKK